MNILHISTAQTWRGGERQVSLLIDGTRKEGHTNFLMAPSNSKLTARIDLSADQVLRYKRGLLASIRNVRSLVNFCQTNAIDIINAHDSHAHSLLLMAYKLGGLKTKSVVTRRLTNPIKKSSQSKYNFSRIEKIICISEAVKKILSPSISDLSRLEVIHSAIDPRPQTIINSDKNTRSKFVIGYVAAFTEEKDHETFLNTAVHVTKQSPKQQFEFLLAGDGPLFKAIKEKAENIADNIKCIGFVEDIDRVYAQMDVLLHTSNSEALGTSILDAMQYGLPIVATHVGGIPEIVMDGKNGLLSAPGDHLKMANDILQLTTNHKLYKEFSNFSLSHSTNFHTSQMVQKTLELYNSVVKS